MSSTRRDRIALRHNTEFVLTDEHGHIKPIWNENGLGRVLRQVLAREFRVKHLTGNWRSSLCRHNLITSVGHAAAAGRLGGLGSYGTFVNLALGTGTAAAAASDTALGTEITTGGGARGAATATQVTTTVTNDTLQLVKTFTFTAALAVTEEGILDNATSGGNLLARQVFAAINVDNGYSLQLTHKVQG